MSPIVCVPVRASAVPTAPPAPPSAHLAAERKCGTNAHEEGTSRARLDRAGDAPPDRVMTGRQSPQRIERLTPLATVLAAIERLAAAAAPYQSSTDSALGLTLAADVTVSQARPAAALALRDGFAVRAEETLDA